MDALGTLDSPPDGKDSPTQRRTTSGRRAHAFMVLSDVVHWSGAGSETAKWAEPEARK